MDININLNQNLEKSNSNFLKELKQVLENIQYYVVDRQEGNFTILENRQTHKMFEVKTCTLPPFLKDGDVLKKCGKNFEFDIVKTNELKKNASEKMKQLFK